MNYLVEQLEHFTGSSEFVMEAGLVPLCSVVQPEVSQEKFEPVTGHCSSIDRIRVPGPEFLKIFMN
jgi:hypothetical protein